MFHKHFVVEPVVSITGDVAAVSSMFARLDRYADGPGIRAFGRYRDTLVRCADGRWRFTARYAEVEATRKEAPLGAQPFPEPAVQDARQTPGDTEPGNKR